MTELKIIHKSDYFRLAERVTAELGRGVLFGEEKLLQRFQMLGVDEPETAAITVTLHLLNDLIYAYIERNYKPEDRSEIITSLSQSLDFKRRHKAKL